MRSHADLQSGRAGPEAQARRQTSRRTSCRQNKGLFCTTAKLIFCPGQRKGKKGMVTREVANAQPPSRPLPPRPGHHCRGMQFYFILSLRCFLITGCERGTAGSRGAGFYKAEHGTNSVAREPKQGWSVFSKSKSGRPPSPVRGCRSLTKRAVCTEGVSRTAEVTWPGAEAPDTVNCPEP